MSSYSLHTWIAKIVQCVEDLRLYIAVAIYTEILKQQFPGLENLRESHGILFHKSLYNIVIFNQVLNP